MRGGAYTAICVLIKLQLSFKENVQIENMKYAAVAIGHSLHDRRNYIGSKIMHFNKTNDYIFLVPSFSLQHNVSSKKSLKKLTHLTRGFLNHLFIKIASKIHLPIHGIPYIIFKQVNIYMISSLFETSDSILGYFVEITFSITFIFKSIFCSFQRICLVFFFFGLFLLYAHKQFTFSSKFCETDATIYSKFIECKNVQHQQLRGVVVERAGRRSVVESVLFTFL